MADERPFLSTFNKMMIHVGPTGDIILLQEFMVLVTPYLLEPRETDSGVWVGVAGRA